jgi:hypothetical protein
MAEENRDWGYRRIQGALFNVGHDLARSTIAEILERHGIEPAPERSRKTTWNEFLTRHWELIVAADFFTVEVWIRRGLQRFIVLFFIELSTRKLEIAGIASVANGLWISQIGRNLTDALDGILNGKRYLIHDRDPLFTTKFLDILDDVGVKSVRIPSGADDPVWRGVIADRHSQFRRPLSHRTQSPGLGQSTHQPRTQAITAHAHPRKSFRASNHAE